MAWNAFGWGATATDSPSILTYSSRNAVTGATGFARALELLGLDHTGFRESAGCLDSRGEGMQAFGEALASRAWDVVIVDHICGAFSIPPETAEALATHGANGGGLIVYSWQLQQERDADRALWESLGVDYLGDLREFTAWGPFPAYWWETDHPLFTSPLPVPEFVGQGWQLVDPGEGFTGVAGYTLAARPGHAGLVVGNHGRTLYRTFFDADSEHNGADLDDNGVPDGVQLWVNSLVQVGGLTPHRWLEVEESGTLAPGDSQPVTVTVDATHLEPGTHSGAVELVSDAARQPQVTIPVTLEVTPDACPDGFSADENIGFGDRDSGVPNYDRGDGCTFLDLVWAEAPFANHGGFVRTVAELVDQWRDDGRFTGREAQAVLVAAARSDVGRPTALTPGLNAVT